MSDFCKTKNKEKFSDTGVNGNASSNPSMNESKDNSFNFSSISGVLNILLSLFKIPEPPIEPLPPPLIMVGRPGLSSKAIASRVISRQSEAGLPVGNVFADGPNITESMTVILIDEIINALLTESVVNVVIPPGIAVTTVGVGNMGAPVVSQGVTVMMGIGNGIIR